MKEVVIIKTKNGTPTDEQPDPLSRQYAHLVGYYERIKIDLKKGRGDTGVLLGSFYDLKSELKCLEQALNGKYNIIVVVDSTCLGGDEYGKRRRNN